MRKLTAYILLLILVISCGNEQKETRKYTIQGEGVGIGTVFLFGTGNEYKQLTSTKCNDKFTLSVPLENNAILTLVLPDERTLTLFAEPGITATLQPDTILKSGWSVKGGNEQHLHDSISRILDRSNLVDKQKSIIDEFTKTFPLSEVTVELYRRYLVEIPEPDNTILQRSIGKLSGTMQDHEYFTNLKRKLEKKPGNIQSKPLPDFNYTTFDNETVNLKTFSKGYLLITFWSTWSDGCLEHLKKLENVEERVEGESFAILNIALESDTALVKDFVENNNITGYNTYDPKGMNSDKFSFFNTTSLPYSILVTPKRYVREYGLELDSADIDLINSLVLKQDKKQKK